MGASGGSRLRVGKQQGSTSISRFSLDKIPAAPGVYALYAHDRALLVGAAANLRDYAAEHLVGGDAPSEALRQSLHELARSVYELNDKVTELERRL